MPQLQLLFLFLLLWLLSIPPEAATLPELPEDYEPPQVVKAALHVLERHVSPRYNELAIMELTHSQALKRKHRQAMSYLLQQLGGRVAVQLLQDAPIEQPRDYILFLVDSPRAFRDLRFHFATNLFDREFNFLVLLAWQGRGKDRALRQIFDTCLRFHVLNVVVLLEDRDQMQGQVLCYGYRLYSPDCRDPLTPQLLNRYAQGQLLEGGTELFQRPMGSFFGCAINVSWYPLPPYVMFDGDPENEEQRLETWRLSGVDGELLKLLAEIYSFRIHLLPPCEKKRALSKKRLKQKQNEQEERQSSSGDCFAQLVELNSSVVIGALSASHLYREHFSITCSYHQSALVFVVRAEHVMGAVSRLVQPFCGTVWCALIMSCVLALLLQWAWRRRAGNFDISEGALAVHTTLLGNPLSGTSVPRAGLLRGVLGTWLLLALVQRVAYQGKLYDVFRLPYYPPLPAQLEDLLREDYIFLAQDFVDYFPKERTLLRPASFLVRFAELEAASPGVRLTTSALLGNLAYYNQLNWQKSRLTHVQEHIYLYQLVMFLRRHSILKFAFDRKLKQLQSAGIVGHINRVYERSMFHAPYSHRPHEVAPIRLEMFCGLYSICSFMLFASVLVFTLELLSLRLEWLRRYFE